ncbi:hypothetical protein M595_0907 [Lyngbya aestuarii BL J]|uniref:Uncharacterized protein n=1 Tax=Lyngbya aestuarii BL J TaxID=1348334 RepID=U7QPK3_9CYAN|nr:hypothetical protein [Lyngbya aestuarii]ERT09217.1 hypothetical protein M595_0907 [Lyngbya aestuarii BL J]
MNTNVSSQSQSNNQPLVLPSLTPEIVQRARQGLEAAQLLKAEAIVEKSLHQFVLVNPSLFRKLIDLNPKI